MGNLPMDNRTRPRPHPTGYMMPDDYQRMIIDKSQRSWSVRDGNMPVVMVVSVVVFLTGLAVIGTRAFGSIEYAVLDMSRKLDSVVSSMSSRMDRMEARTADRWTRQNHDYWCSKTEQLNSKIGWRCADSPRLDPSFK